MVCKNCHSYKVFGKSCWFFWENKSACSQFVKVPGEEPKYEEKKEN